MRDIQHAALGKVPYDLLPSYHHLAVMATSWSGMKRKEMERHLKLGKCITEEIEEDNKEETFLDRWKKLSS